MTVVIERAFLDTQSCSTRPASEVKYLENTS